MLCDECDLWHHSDCLGLSLADYQALQEESVNIQWLCPACQPAPASTSLNSAKSAPVAPLGSSLSTFYTNTRSLLLQIDELRLMAATDRPDIIAIAETWLDSSVKDCEVSISSYLLQGVMQ